MEVTGLAHGGAHVLHVAVATARAASFSATPRSAIPIGMARDRGYSWSSIARALNGSELDPAQGGRRWYASTVRAIYLRQTLGRGGSQPVRDEASDDN
jgi:hypothetical protein